MAHIVNQGAVLTPWYLKHENYYKCGPPPIHCTHEVLFCLDYMDKIANERNECSRKKRRY